MLRGLLSCSVATAALLAASAAHAQTATTASTAAEDTAAAENTSTAESTTADPSVAQAAVPGASKSDIIVVGIRGSVVTAAKKKKNAKQIVDSVVSEDVGKLPDNNVPDALSRVTGVQIDRARGQGQSVSIRGLDAISTTVNGNNTNLGDGRSLNLADIPAELLKSVDVYKTRTPDQVEGGIAGTVNVELRRPLDLPKGFTIAGSLKGVYDDIAKKTSPYGSILLADHVDTGIGEIGFLVNASYTKSFYRENYIESESPDVPCCEGDANSAYGGLPAGYKNTVIPYRIYYGLESGYVKRPSINASLQWRPSDKLDFVLEGGYLGSREKRTLDRLYLQTREYGYSYNDIVLQPNGEAARSFTVTNPSGLAAGVDSVYNNFFSDLYTTNFETHFHSGRVQLNSSIQYNWSREGNYIVEQVLRPGALTTATVDFASSQYGKGVPSFNFTGVDLSDPSIYTVDRFQDLVGGSKNKEFAAQSDLTVGTSDEGLLRSIQIGFRYSNRTTSRYYGYRDGYPRVDGDRAPLSSFPGGTDAVQVGPGFNGAPAWYRIPGQEIVDNINDVLAYIRATDPADAARFSSDTPPSDRGQTFRSREFNFAGYGQLNYAMKLGVPIDGIVGVRYTNTWGRSDSFNYRPGDATNGYQDIVLESPGRGNYVDVLPSATAVLHFTPKIQLRLAYSTNVQRPSFYDSRPFYYAETRAVPPVIYAGNPSLKAQREHSFDASAEYYFGRGGQLTFAGYYKKATGFLYYSREAVSDLSAYGLSGVSGFVEQLRNAGDGTFAGLEGTAQTFFDFAPGFLRNFGVSLNASYLLKARVVYPYAEDFPGAFDSPGTSKWTANAALFYDTPKFSARAAFNYRSSYRIAVFTDNPAYSPYNDDTYRLDVAINYTPVKFMTLSLEGGNVLGNDVYRYFGKNDLIPLGVRTLARTVQTSIRFRF